jgi:transcriptional regulator with XRE-family HTH domain
MAKGEYDISTARRRELGNELKFVREQAKLSGHALARIVGWLPSTISRYEGGQRTPSELDVAVFLTACGVRRDELVRLLELAREADMPYWVRPLPDGLRSLMIQEGSAAMIRSYEPLVVPGLLQTEEYIRAIYRWSNTVDEKDIDRMVDSRLSRQSLLRRRNPPRSKFYVHERALRSVIGGAQVMHEQLLQLVFAASQLHCSVRVVLESAGSYNILDAPFKVFDYAIHRPAAYVATPTAGVFIEEPADVTTYSGLLDRLDRDALDGAQSVEWLAALANHYDRLEEQQDARTRLVQEQPQQRR